MLERRNHLPSCVPFDLLSRRRKAEDGTPENVQLDTLLDTIQVSREKWRTEGIRASSQGLKLPDGLGKRDLDALEGLLRVSRVKQSHCGHISSK